MAIDRERILADADTLLRQGRLDAAIAEYRRVVDAYPHDWATANTLGDCYYRARQIDGAVAQYNRIADQLAAEGHAAKAIALYKKTLRIAPADEHALARAADIAVAQGAAGDARAFLEALVSLRRARGDEPGAADAARRLSAVNGAATPPDTAGPDHPAAAASRTDASRDPFGLGPIAIDLHDILGDAADADPEPAGEIDLSAAVAQLNTRRVTRKRPAQPPGAPDEPFREFRDEVSRQTDVQRAEQHFKVGLAYKDVGMTAEAIRELQAASRAPRLRFEAASLAARLLVEAGDRRGAIEWFERAAEAPAPSAESGRSLLYDLASALEAEGDAARALAVFSELQADAGEYRDVTRRVERLGRVQTGG